MFQPLEPLRQQYPNLIVRSPLSEVLPHTHQVLSVDGVDTEPLVVLEAAARAAELSQPRVVQLVMHDALDSLVVWHVPGEDYARLVLALLAPLLHAARNVDCAADLDELRLLGWAGSHSHEDFGVEEAVDVPFRCGMGFEQLGFDGLVHFVY